MDLFPVKDDVLSLVNRLPGLRNRAFFVSDIVLLPACAALSFTAPSEGPLSGDIRQTLFTFVIASVPLKVVALVLVGMYRRLWRYASVTDLEMLLVGAAVCAVIDVVVGAFVLPALGLIPVRL